MSKQAPLTYKENILDRYCMEFLPATDKDATIRKTSEQIMLDLRPMAEFTADEISEYFSKMKYNMGMDDATPVWLMWKE